MGKRGQPLRQHQSLSKPRLVRRPPPVVPQVSNTTKPPVEDVTPDIFVPPHCDPPLPDIHCLGNIGFEFLLWMYLHTALFCQYIYLYKTVWWYPISLPPSSTSLNFHQIDQNLTMFLSIFILRRLLWSILWDFFRPNAKNAPGIMAWLLFCLASGIAWICVIFCSIFNLFLTAPVLNLVVLCYPMILWLPLTGLSGHSCLSAILSWMSIVDSPKVLGSDSSGNIFSRHLLSHDAGLARLAYRFSASNRINTDSSQVKQIENFSIHREIKLLCTDFNSRISEIIFCSMVCAYYVGLVPMFFMKSHQYYDMIWSLLHTLLVLFNSFGLLSSHLLNPQYVHFIHKCILWHDEIGRKLKENTAMAVLQNSKPSDRTENSGGNIPNEIQIHEDLSNDSSVQRLCSMFRNPLKLTDWSLGCHAAIVAFQGYLLFTSSKWDHLISIALMQFFSYYVLFRTMRDRSLLSKARQLHLLML